jgi:hypothetical protein
MNAFYGVPRSARQHIHSNVLATATAILAGFIVFGDNKIAF